MTEPRSVEPGVSFGRTETLTSSRTLGIAFLVALVFHGLLLALVGVRRPDWLDHPPLSPPILDVVILHQAHRTDRVPEPVDAYAQVDRQGGGTPGERTETDRRPIPQAPEPSDPVASLPPTQEIPSLEPSSARRALPPAAAIEPEPVLTTLTADESHPTQVTEPLTPPEVPSETEVEIPRESLPKSASGIFASRGQEIAKLRAKILRDSMTYASRTRRRAISASTREYKYASYLESWRRKVERVGNLNYPEEAKRRKLHGNLILRVSLYSDGTIENIRVLRSSGSRVLDQAAIRIVELAAPFAPFPPDIRAETDILDITRTWQFLSSHRLGWK